MNKVRMSKSIQGLSDLISGFSLDVFHIAEIVEYINVQELSALVDDAMSDEEEIVQT